MKLWELRWLRSPPRVHIVVSKRQQRIRRHIRIQCDREPAGVHIKIAERGRRYMRDLIERMHSVQIEHFVSQVCRCALATPVHIRCACPVEDRRSAIAEIGKS